MPTANANRVDQQNLLPAAAAIRMDGPDRDPMIARILAYWPPTDRYWPCHGHMDGGHLHMDGGHWESSGHIHTQLRQWDSVYEYWQTDSLPTARNTKLL